MRAAGCDHRRFELDSAQGGLFRTAQAGSTRGHLRLSNTVEHFLIGRSDLRALLGADNPGGELGSESLQAAQMFGHRGRRRGRCSRFFRRPVVIPGMLPLPGEPWRWTGSSGDLWEH